MLLSLGAANRTDTAYSDYLARSGASDVVINPSLSMTPRSGRVIRSLPGTQRVTSDTLLLATAPDDGAPRTVAEIVDEGIEAVQIRGSADGRFTTMDRPAVEEGRLPTSRREAFLNPEFAKSSGCESATSCR